MSGWVLIVGFTVVLLAVIVVLFGVGLSTSREGAILEVRLRRGRGADAADLYSARLDLGEGVLTYLLVIAIAWLSALSVANSSWVTRIDIVPLVAVVGSATALVLAKVCRRGTTFWLAAEVSAVVGLFVATAAHTGWRLDQDLTSWVLAVRGSLQLALLVTILAAAWLLAAWLVFWTVRLRRVPVALAPLVVALVVEVLEDPGQKGLALLVALWIMAAAALAIRVHLAGLDRRWGSRASDEVSMSLGIHGARVVVVILVLAFLAPPLSNVDLTARLFAGQKSNPGQGNAAGPGNGPGAGLIQTGYTEKVEPGGTIVRSQDAVLEVSNDFSAGVYWRGINLYAVNNGAWETGESSRLTAPAAAGASFETATYLARRQVHGTVRVLGVPSQTLFFPGDPVRTSVNSQVRGDPQDVGGRRGPLLGALPIDGAYALPPVQPGNSYTVDASYSVATEDQLRSAGTSYPTQVAALTQRVGSSGSTRIDPGVAQLARQVAGSATSPYDQAKAIESYLRTNLKYQLQVDAPPKATDPISFFLFQSKTGYCEYFASSMGEMLRSLGIPVRLVNGYGPGSQPSDRELNIAFRQATEPPRLIHAADAHTWVEVFFPSYGWVPFEPTPDPAYPALGRGAPLAQPAAEPNPAPVVAAPAVAEHPTGVRALLGPAIGAGGLVVVLLLLLLVARAVARGPSRLESVLPAWRRMGWVGTRLGVRRRDSDTPLEFSQRLARVLPGLESEIDELGRAYSRDCYRREGLDAEGLRRADRAWSRLRPALIRALLTGRFPAAAPA